MTNLEEKENEFEEKWQELGNELRSQTTYNRTTRTITKWLIVSLVLDIVLTIALTFGYNQLHNTSRVVYHNSSRAVVACRASNEARSANMQLWNFVLSFPAPTNESPEQQKTTQEEIAKFKIFLDKSFAQKKCD